jgi:sarcosine oxidase, subunit beta
VSREVADVVIVGGGATGTSIAWHLAQRGAGRVVLIEREAIGAGGTGWSSAIIRQHYTHETLARMALRSLQVFEQFEEVVGGTAEFHRTGFLVLVKPEDAGTLAANVEMHRRVGIEATVLTGDQVRDLEPRINCDDILAAAWEPRSGYADPVAVAKGYADAAQRNGAEILSGTSVESIVTGPAGVEEVMTNRGRISTRTVVVAAGFRTCELVALHGVSLPITPIRHDIAIVGRSPNFGPPHPIISDRINGSYFRPEGIELTMIGTTAADEGYVDAEVEVNREPYPEDTEKLVSRFSSRFPNQDDATLRRGYTGTYDCSPDLQPLLGPVAAIPGLHVAVGFSGHGFKLSPVIGELMADLILNGQSTIADNDFFSPDRFETGEAIQSTRAYSVGTLG